MKQILQSFRTGELQIAEVPPPAAQSGRVRVRTVASLISSGTERMSLQLGKQTLLGKARERPDLVKQVIEKVKTEGLINTANVVRARLDSSKALGYSASGIVIDAGEDVTTFRAGDRVACAGAGYASHAEVLSVPQNLCVRLPPDVDFQAGAFGTIGAIALQGVRLAEPTLGEAVVVIGLGLLGQLTLQLLKAAGCRVFGVDLDPSRVKLATELGADAAETISSDTSERIVEWTRGRGADAVLITAAASSNEPIQLAGAISRLRGRVVAVGLVGLEIPRETFYERELTLKISMSYGPGRYDPEYEERGHDYPFAYVRWTENRNIEAFLDLVAGRRISWEPLITHRFPIEEAERAYQLIGDEHSEPYLAVMLDYDVRRALPDRVELKGKEPARQVADNTIRVGVIGAGRYVGAKLLPHFRAPDVKFQAIATASGVSAQELGKKFGFTHAVSGADEVTNDPEIDLVIIGTRHNLHAQLVCQALETGKHVFVEKPLALNDVDLDKVISTASKSQGRLMVGFNRRFSPLARAGKEFFANRDGPLSILYRVNAGRISPSDWAQDPVEGGGRIVGEVCHFVDLMQFWIGAPPITVFAEPVSVRDYRTVSADSVFITLRFADGSNGCVAYLSDGDKGLPKERAEVFGGQKSFVLDDFRSATFYEQGSERKKKLRVQDKGQADEIRIVREVIREGRAAPISLAELTATTRATFRILKSIRTGQPQSVGTGKREVMSDE